MAEGDTLIDDNGDEVLLVSGSVHLEKEDVETEEDCCCDEPDCGCGVTAPSMLNVALADLNQDVTGGEPEQILSIVGLLTGRNWTIPYLFSHLDEGGNPVCEYACLIHVGTDEGCGDSLPYEISCDWFLAVNVSLSATALTVWITLYAPGTFYIVFAGSFLWTEEDPQTCDGPTEITNAGDPWGPHNIFGGGTVTVTSATSGAVCEEQCGDCPCPCPFRYCLYLRFDDEGDSTVIKGVLVQMSLQTWRLTDVTIDGAASTEFFVALACVGGSPARFQIYFSDGRTGSPLGSGVITGIAVGCPDEVTDWELIESTVETLTLPTILLSTKTAGSTCPDPLGCADLGDCVMVVLTRRDTDCDGAQAATAFVKDLQRDTPGVDTWSNAEDGWDVEMVCEDGHFTLTASKGAEDWVLESDDGRTWTTTGGTHTSELCVEYFENCIEQAGGCLGCPEDTATISGTESGTYDDVMAIEFVDAANCVISAVAPEDVNAVRVSHTTGSGYWEAIYEPNGFGTSPSYKWRKPVTSSGQCPANGTWYVWQTGDANLPSFTLA